MQSAYQESASEGGIMRGVILPVGEPGAILFAFEWTRGDEELVRVIHRVLVTDSRVHVQYSHHEYYSRVQQGWQIQRRVISPPTDQGFRQVVMGSFTQAVLSMSGVEYTVKEGVLMPPPGAAGTVGPGQPGWTGQPEAGAPVSRLGAGAVIALLVSGVMADSYARRPDLTPDTTSHAMHMTLDRMGTTAYDFAGLLRISPGTLRSAMSKGAMFQVETLQRIGELVRSRGFRRLADWWDEMAYQARGRQQRKGGR